jgi:hypothetical protein
MIVASMTSRLRWWRCAVLPLRDALKWEYDERLKGRPRYKALEKWGPEIAAQIMHALRAEKSSAELQYWLEA